MTWNSSYNYVMAGLMKKDENSKQNVVFISIRMYIYIHRYVEHLSYEYIQYCINNCAVGITRD